MIRAILSKNIILVTSFDWNEFPRLPLNLFNLIWFFFPLTAMSLDSDQFQTTTIHWSTRWCKSYLVTVKITKFSEKTSRKVFIYFDPISALLLWLLMTLELKLYLCIIKFSHFDFLIFIQLWLPRCTYCYLPICAITEFQFYGSVYMDCMYSNVQIVHNMYERTRQIRTVTRKVFRRWFRELVQASGEMIFVQ